MVIYWIHNTKTDHRGFPDFWHILQSLSDKIVQLELLSILYVSNVSADLRLWMFWFMSLHFNFIYLFPCHKRHRTCGHASSSYSLNNSNLVYFTINYDILVQCPILHLSFSAFCLIVFQYMKYKIVRI